MSNTHAPLETNPLGGSKIRYHLTFDIDWAPDSSIEKIVSLLKHRNLKATFFITHQSDIIPDLINAGHEVGLHPNFLPNSSHGEKVEDIIEYLLNIVPTAEAIRTHALVQSSPLLHKIFSTFPQLKYDFSIFMYRFPHIAPFEWTFGGAQFTRFNYNWEDDAAFFDDSFSWSKPFFPGPVCIYDFHPIHIDLNSKNEANYDQLKKANQEVKLWSLKDQEIERYRNTTSGAHTFFKELINSSATHIGYRELL